MFRTPNLFDDKSDGIISSTFEKILYKMNLDVTDQHINVTKDRIMVMISKRRHFFAQTRLHSAPALSGI